MHPTKRLMTPEQVEAEFGFPCASQSKWRMNGSFVAFIRAGRHVYYERRDIERWLQEGKRLDTRGTIAPQTADPAAA